MEASNRRRWVSAPPLNSCNLVAPLLTQLAHKRPDRAARPPKLPPERGIDFAGRQAVKPPLTFGKLLHAMLGSLLTAARRSSGWSWDSSLLDGGQFGQGDAENLNLVVGISSMHVDARMPSQFHSQILGHGCVCQGACKTVPERVK